MATVSSETLILFIASILVAASVAGTMTTGVNRLSESLGDRSIDVSEEIRTDIEIISDPGSNAVYDANNETVILLLKNTGSSTLSHDPSAFDVMIDGSYQTNRSTSVIGGETWGVGDVTRLEISGVTLSSGDHRIVIIVNDDREVLEIRQ